MKKTLLLTLSLIPLLGSCGGSSVTKYKYSDTYNFTYNNQNSKKISDYTSLHGYADDKALATSINNYFIYDADGNKMPGDCIHLGSLEQMTDSTTGKVFFKGDVNKIEKSEYSSSALCGYSKYDDGYHFETSTSKDLHILNRLTSEFSFGCITQAFTLDNKEMNLKVNGLLKIDDATVLDFVVTLNFKKV